MKNIFCLTLFCLLGFSRAGFPGPGFSRAGFSRAGFSWVSAQPSVSFFVFSIKGNGVYLRDRFRIPLKIGTALSVTDQLVLGANTEVQLLCNKFSLFTIRSIAAGKTTMLQKYADSCKDAGKSAATQTLAYIWNRFSAGEANASENEVARNKNDYLQEYGADTRGCSDPVFSAFPDTLAIYRKDFFICYRPADTAEKYQLCLFANGRGGVPLYQASLVAGRFEMPVSGRLFQQLDTGSICYYNVTRNGQELCGRKILLRLGDHTLAEIRQAASSGSDFKQLSPAGKQLITAYFFEKAHLLAEADGSYHETLQKDPGNTLAALQAANLERLIGTYR